MFYDTIINNNQEELHNRFLRKKVLINIRYVLFVSILILSYSFNLYSQPIMTGFKPSDSTKQQLFDFRLSIELPNASMRYDENAEDILEDTLYFTDSSNKSHKYQYTTDVNQQKYSLNIGYLGLKNFYAYIKIPIVYSAIEEKFKYDSSFSTRYKRNEDSKLYLEGTQINAGYCFDFDFLKLNLVGEIFFPFYKYQTMTDTTSEYINNKKIELGRTLETSFGTRLNFNLKPVNFELGGLYNIRNDNFTDRLKLNLLIGLNNIENTELFVNFEYLTSLDSFKDDYRVSFWRETLWEKCFNAHLGFKMFFTDEFYADIGYAIKLWGKNTIASRSVKINLGYILPY